MGIPEVAEQLAKILPVEKIYDDLASPAFKQMGKAFEDVVKCIRLATFPIQVGSASQEQLERFLRKAVEDVPEERRILPPTQILGPVIEAMRYEPEDTDIERMFSQLLSSSMNNEKVKFAHPAFPTLIRQLSKDEAVLLREITNRPNLKHVATYRFDDGRSYFDEIELDELPRSVLSHPENAMIYVNHLRQLGVVDFTQSEPQEPIMGRRSHGIEYQSGVRVRSVYTLTDFGKLLAQAVFK